MKKIVLWMGVVLVAGALLGCRTVSWQGGRLRPGAGFALEEKGNGRYRTRDVEIRYEYKIRGQGVEIAGEATFAPHLQRNFSLIRRFHLGLIQGDGEGNVLAMQGLVSASMRSPERSLKFSKLVALSPQARRLAFHFNGHATEGGGRGFSHDNGGVDTEFWHYPVGP